MKPWLTSLQNGTIMNKQDEEDFFQDFALCMHKGKYTPTEIKSYRGFYARSRELALNIKQNRRQRLLKEYANFLTLSDFGTFNEQLYFAVLEKFNFLTKKQKVVLQEYLKCGNLIDTAKNLNASYNTTKAHFFTGVKALRELTKGFENISIYSNEGNLK